MSKETLLELNIRLGSLAIFRDLLDDPVIGSLCRYLSVANGDDTPGAVSAYAEFVSTLYSTGRASLAGYVQAVVSENENAYIRLIGQGKQPCVEMEGCVGQELQVLQAVADLTPDALRSGIQWRGFLPAFPVEKVDISTNYLRRCENIGKFGYGIYAKYHMFFINPAGSIVPVRNPDQTRLSSLVDYKREQKIILDNTLALLGGKPAANILLTGDAGTGKSSTVKAVVNELYEQGLRILEVRKEQLHQIPAILDELNTNPLKFILFIDDLSFQKDDDNFSALKAILEGSVSAKSRNDTMQEIISLSERFGIQITFQKPDKATYLDIVHHLAAEKGVEMEAAELDQLAERFALSRGGRSARAANQFVDSLIAAK